MLELHLDPQGTVHPDKSTERVVAEGDIEIKKLVLKIICVVLVIITIGGIYGLIVNEPVFGKYWLGIQTIISGTIFGLVGFIAGRSTITKDN